MIFGGNWEIGGIFHQKKSETMRIMCRMIIIYEVWRGGSCEKGVLNATGAETMIDFPYFQS